MLSHPDYKFTTTTTRCLVFASLAASLLLACMECRAQSSTTESQASLTLPANTPVKLRLKQTLYGKDAQPGRHVEFEVVENVLVNGEVVIESGTTATGSIRQINRKGKGPGELLIDLGHTRAVTGEEVRLVGPATMTGAATDRDKMTVKDVAAGASVPEALPLVPVALIMVLFPGKKALLYEGTREIAYLGEPVVLDPAKLRAAQANVARPGYATVLFSRRFAIKRQPIICNSVRIDPSPVGIPFGSFVVLLRPGHYLCHAGADETAAYDFEEGREYYFLIKDSSLSLSGTVNDWNIENDVHDFDVNRYDRTMSSLDLAWKYSESEIVSRFTENIPLSLDRTVMAGAFELSPGPYQILLIENGRTKGYGTLYFFSGENIAGHDLKAVVNVRVLPAKSPATSAQATIVIKDTVETISEIRMGMKTIRLQ